MKTLSRLTACFAIAIGVIAPTMGRSQPAQSDIDLSNYDLTWADEFNDARLRFTDGYQHALSASGTGAAWIDHTPWYGDFGDSAFTGLAFSMSGGAFLNIKAWKDPATGRWFSGLLSSVDKKGNGFKQQYGYFEVRMKVPGGMGTWPAFWLSGYPANPKVEIDVVEFYGGRPTAYHQNFHIWDGKKQTSSAGHVSDLQSLDLTRDFHIYGVTVDKDFITFYLDGAQQYQVATPPDANQPVGVLLNYALGSGWGVSGVGDPSYLVVDWVRVYRRK